MQALVGGGAALLGVGDYAGSAATFQRARLLDPLNVRGMDVYAALLLDRQNHDELRKLSHDVTDVDLALPEVWAVMACFWQMKQNWDKALEFVDRYALLASRNRTCRVCNSKRSKRGKAQRQTRSVWCWFV